MAATESQKKSFKKYYEANKEEIKASRKLWYEANKQNKAEERKIRSKEWKLYPE